MWEIPKNMLPVEPEIPDVKPLEVTVSIPEIPMGEGEDLEEGVLIFGKEGCAKCRTVKHKLSFILRERDVPIAYWDINTVNGLALASFYDLNTDFNKSGYIPLVIIRKAGKIVQRWDGEIPNSQELLSYL